MRIGGAQNAPPPSQTGRALLTHPAFRSAAWLPRPTCGKADPRRTEGLLPQQQSSLLWTQFPEPSIGLGLTQAETSRHWVFSLAALSQPLARGPVPFPFHHFPTPLGSTIITRFSATTGALTPADLFLAIHRGSLIHVALTSFHAISNHLCPSASRDPLPLRCRLYFVRTSSFARRLVTGTDRIEFTFRRLPSALLRPGISLPVALHPGVSPRCSYFQILALQCRPGRELSSRCHDALSGARARAVPARSV
jgi:hypothetical protein